MTRQEILNQINMVEAQIATLPAGTVVYKKIKEKKQPYLQWAEDGKTKCRYVKESERQAVFEQVEHRRRLAEKLKQLKAELASLPTSAEVPEFHTRVVQGKELIRMVGAVINYGHRDCFRQLQEYLDAGRPGEICMLYGLRGTGKTTLMYQAILELRDEIAHVAFIAANPANTMADVDHDLKLLVEQGYRWTFIDGVTSVDGFLDAAALLSDVYAMQGMKIVLSGEESLTFWMALAGQLYGRASVIYMTGMTFRETCRLYRDCDFDRYIHFGGTPRINRSVSDNRLKRELETPFRDSFSTRRYIEAAVCENLRQTMSRRTSANWFGVLRPLYELGQLSGAILEALQAGNRMFLLDALERWRAIREQEAPLRHGAPQGEDTVDEANVQAILDGVTERLKEEASREEGMLTTPAQRAEILRALKAMDLVVERQAAALFPGITHEGNVLFAQPGMRYGLQRALVKELLDEEAFSGFSERERSRAYTCMTNAAREQLMRDTVLLEMMKALPPEKSAFKLDIGTGENGIVVCSPDEDTCEVFDVKLKLGDPRRRSSVLMNPEMMAAVERKYGKINRRCVLTAGRIPEEDGEIEYLNLEEYLKDITVR